MSAAKTGLPEYRRGTVSVYAAKITAIEQHKVSGALKLYFGDLDKEANVRPEWVLNNNPQVGGYFVVEDTNDPLPLCVYSPAKVFEADTVKVPL